MTRDILVHGVAELSERDDSLAASVARWGLPPLWNLRPGFATLIRIILGQQVSLASASAAYRRLQIGLGRVTAARIAASSAAILRENGLTTQKAMYCHELARAVVEGVVDLRWIEQTDGSRARQSLLSIRGVGPWSADIYMLMALGRPDVWPVGDIALAESVRMVRHMKTRPAQDRLTRIASSWKPWRSVAARILWHHYLSVMRANRRARAARPVRGRS